MLSLTPAQLTVLRPAAAPPAYAIAAYRQAAQIPHFVWFKLSA